MISRSQRVTGLFKLGYNCMRLVQKGQSAAVPEAIYTTFRGYGGVYVKFLQLLVLRSEAFQKLKDYDIYDIYDRVEFEAIDIEQKLRDELGAQQAMIKLESTMPIAAGSFGQVYIATYGDTTVILKILRPSIRSGLKFDLRLLGVCSYLVDLFAAGSAVSMRNIYREFYRVTLRETNYLLEADYASTLHRRYQDHPQLVIPRTFRELCTSQIICQEYVAGLRATDLTHLVAQGYDAQDYVRTTLGSDISQQLVAVGTEMLSGIFEYGSTYGDPHPGNLAFLPDNKVVIYDFGLPATAPANTLLFHKLIEEYYKIYSGQPDIDSYSRVLLDMYGGDIIRAAHSLDDYYGKGPENLIDGILYHAGEIMKVEKEKTDQLLQNNKLMLLFSTVVNKNNRYCLRYELDGPEIIRAGILFIALTENLGVKNTVLRQTYGAVLERTKTISLTTGREQMHLETAHEVLADWIDSVAHRNPYLHHKIKQKGLNYV